MKMVIKDFLHLDVNMDIVDDVCGGVYIGFVGPISLTEEGKKHFARALDLEIEVASTADQAVITVSADAADVWKENLKNVKELFTVAAGICPEGQWEKWFKKHIDVSIRYEDIQTIEKKGWMFLGIDEQNNSIIVEIRNSSPLGEDLVEDIWLEDGDSMEAAAYKWADSFDVDEHVSIYVEHRGEDGVPDSIEDLVEDAKDIKRMICDLARAFGDDGDNDESNAEQPEICSMVTISTAHITETTASALHGITHRHPAYGKEAMAWPTVYEKGDCGYFLYIPDDLYDRENDIPKDLYNCCCYAAAKGCAWLVLDHNGPIMANYLPTYEW